MTFNDDIKPSLSVKEWHLPDCYGCGEENHHGLKTDFPFDEESGEVRFEYTPRGFEIGAPGFFHGGILATLMDEAQGALCFHIGHMIMTDQLEMKYHQASPIDAPLQIRCWLTAQRRRRLYTRGTIHSKEGTLLVTSHATWYLLPERVSRRLIYKNEHAPQFEHIRQVMKVNRQRAKEIRRRLRANSDSRT